MLTFLAAPPVGEPADVAGCGRARVKHEDELCFPDAKMTVEAWVRTEPSKGWMRIVSKYGHTRNGKEDLSLRAWELNIKDTKVLMFRAVPYSEDSSAPWFSLESKSPIPTGRWTHVAFALDGPEQSMRMYINGKLDAQRAVKARRLQVNPGQDMYFGVYGGYDAHLFKGLIDEVRLTADALRFDGPPTAPYSGKEPQTVALYHFDKQQPGGAVLNAVDPKKHRAALVDGDLPSLAASMPGFGRALRLTGVKETRLPFEQRYSFKPIPHPTLDELGQLGAAWQKRYPKRIHAEVLGRGSDDLPLHALTITDFTVSDEDKEVVLMAGMHVGGEISGGTALMAFAEWLLGDDRLAATIRARQICVLVPVANPYGYGKTSANKWRHDPAWSWSADGATFADENPEGVLVQGLIDRLKPEVLVDSHGTVLVGQYMGEFLGSSGYSLILNTFQGTLVREMARAAGEVGFPQHLAAETHEKILASEPVPGCTHEFFQYLSGKAMNAPVYSYIRYHTIPMSMESGGWAGSAVARLKRLMAIGCERWPTECYPGYPNRRISSPTTWMQWLAAYGQTARARRASRVELWQKQKQLARFATYPDMDAAFLFGVATTPAAAMRVLQSGSRSGRVSLGRFLLNIESAPDMDSGAIRRHIQETGCLSIRHDPLPARSVEAEPIQHGLALRSMLPYARPTISEVRLNGKLLGESASDGYQVWHGYGGTYVQVNIPPGKTGGLHIVSCRYDGRERRPWGFRPKPIAAE